MMGTIVRKLIRADGSSRDLAHALSIADIKELISAEALDIVRLRHWGERPRVMFVDDIGHVKDLPINVKTARLYWANCIPGTTPVIVGDAVVVPHDDFAQRG